MFNVNNRNSRKRCEKCSKLTIKTPERRHWRRSGVFIVNFKHMSHLFLEFLLLTLNKYMFAGIIVIFSRGQLPISKVHFPLTTIKMEKFQGDPYYGMI